MATTAKELRDLDRKGLNESISNMRVELFNLRMQKTTMGIDKPHQMKVIKKKIARALTISNEKKK